MSIATTIEKFEGISLAQMDSVKLMNRTDRKYWFNIDHLDSLLLTIIDNYYILEIDGKRNQSYHTTYYDTAEDQMYINHHRGKLNRYKIRRRRYVATNDSFLEIKFKNNKGRTIKERISISADNGSFDSSEQEFILNRSPYTTDQLKAVLTNGFKRLMLVSKSMNERCTIDQEIAFVSNGVEIKLDELVVVEVKGSSRDKSTIIDAMHAMRLKPSGFSKYCIGRSITNRELRSGQFRLKHRLLEKTINNTINHITTQI